MQTKALMPGTKKALAIQGSLRFRATSSGRMKGYPQGDSNPLLDSPKGKRPQDIAETPLEPLAQTLAHETQIESGLALLFERWDALPEAMRVGIVAMVRAATRDAF
jgi:hypothetical protein